MITLQGKTGKYFFNPDQGLIRSNGKFNQVYKGYNELYRPVLIKKLLPSLGRDEIALKRFRNEFTLHVAHPNIIAGIDYIEQEQQHYIIRNWIEGKDLAQKNKFSIKEAVRVCIAVLHALKHLHQQRILHLDVQPKNIIIGDDGAVYLSDLGLAAHMDQPKQRQPFNIYYSAPEQILNQYQLFDASTDLFAAGMILLELITRSKPHHHHNPEILMNLVMASPLVNSSKINEKIFAIIQKATRKPRFNLPPSHYSHDELEALLKKEQANRYLDAGAFINDLLALSGDDLKPRPWWKF